MQLPGEFNLRNVWWQRGRDPKARVNRNDAGNQQRNTRAGCEYEGHRSANLHCVSASSDHPSIDSKWGEPAGPGPTSDRHEGREPDRKARPLRSDPWHHASYND